MAIPKTPAEIEQRERETDSDRLDEALEQSFPASDPPAAIEPRSHERAPEDETPATPK